MSIQLTEMLKAYCQAQRLCYVWQCSTVVANTVLGQCLGPKLEPIRCNSTYSMPGGKML